MYYTGMPSCPLNIWFLKDLVMRANEDWPDLDARDHVLQLNLCTSRNHTHHLRGRTVTVAVQDSGARTVASLKKATLGTLLFPTNDLVALRV